MSDLDIPDHPRRSIGLKLTVISRQLRQRFDERVEEMGVTRAKWMVIAAISRNPGVTQRSIAASLEVTDVTAGRLIDRLCADGLLERRENRADRRAYCLHLTPEARPILEKMAKAAEEYEAEVFAGFSDEELGALSGLLDRMARNLGGFRLEGYDRKAPVDAKACAPAEPVA